MVIALNRSVVIEEVVRWTRYQIWHLLGCKWSEVVVAMEPKGKSVLASFGGPEIGDPKHEKRLRAIYLSAMQLAEERLAGLDGRRVA